MTGKSGSAGQIQTRTNRLVQKGQNKVDLEKPRPPDHTYPLAVDPGAVYRNRKAAVGPSYKMALAAERALSYPDLACLAGPLPYP